MERTKLIILIIFIICLFGGEIKANTATKTNDVNSTNRFCIAFKNKTSAMQIENTVNRISGKIIKKINTFSFPVYVVEVPNPSNDANYLNGTIVRLEKEPCVAFVSSEHKNMEVQKIEAPIVKRRGDINISRPGVSKEINHEKNTVGNFYEIILNHTPGLYNCIEKNNRIKKCLKISALFEISIDAKGSVKYVRLLEGNIRDPKINKCLCNKIRSWKDFPRRNTAQELRIKFRFEY